MLSLLSILTTFCENSYPSYQISVWELSIAFFRSFHFSPGCQGSLSLNLNWNTAQKEGMQFLTNLHKFSFAFYSIDTLRHQSSSPHPKSDKLSVPRWSQWNYVGRNTSVWFIYTKSKINENFVNPQSPTSFFSVFKRSLKLFFSTIISGLKNFNRNSN